MSAKNIGVSVLLLVVGVASGCATGAPKLSRPVEAQEAKVEKAQAQRLVVGPAVLHAYPEATSGDMWLVKVQTGEHSDCLQVNSVRRPLVAGKRMEVVVAANEMVCASTRRSRPVKISWHVHRAPVSAAPMVASVPSVSR